MQEEIKTIVFEALSELNYEKSTDKNSDMYLFGEKGFLDSMGLVNLVVIIEEKLQDQFNINLLLVNEKAMSQKHSPFRSVDSLTSYIANALNNENSTDKEKETVTA